MSIIFLLGHVALTTLERRQLSVAGRSYQTIVDQMSPSRQGEVALQVNEIWMQHVWYFRTIPGKSDNLSKVFPLPKQRQRDQYTKDINI